MIQDINHLTIVGTLSQDVQITKTKNHDSMAILNMVTTKEWSKDGEIKKKSELVSIFFFGNKADSCKLYKAGMKIHVTAEVKSKEVTEGDSTTYKTIISGQHSWMMDLGTKNRPSPDVDLLQEPEDIPF
jgi:single-stranded DNA-binding protein